MTFLQELLERRTIVQYASWLLNACSFQLVLLWCVLLLSNHQCRLGKVHMNSPCQPCEFWYQGASYDVNDKKLLGLHWFGTLELSGNTMLERGQLRQKHIRHLFWPLIEMIYSTDTITILLMMSLSYSNRRLEVGHYCGMRAPLWVLAELGLRPCTYKAITAVLIPYCLVNIGNSVEWQGN